MTMASALRPLRCSALRLKAPVARRYSSTFGYTQAKALVYENYGNPLGKLQLHSYSISPASGSDILIKFLASPINPADINQIEGVYPSKPSFNILLGTMKPVAVGGNEGVVEVVSVGADVKSFSPGDRAIMKYSSFGTWRTHAIAIADNLIKIPQDINVLSAATVTVNPCTAYRMLKDFGRLQPGDYFIQNGANSGVGRAAIQLGRMWGLKSINLIRSREKWEATEKLKEELYALGADEVLTYSEAERDAPAGDVVKARCQKAKLMLNCAGGKDALKAHAFLADSAEFVTYGSMTKSPLAIHAGNLIFKDLHYHGFWISRWNNRNPVEREKMLEEILNYIKQGTFKDPPLEKTVWKHDTTEDDLKKAVQNSTLPKRNAKQVFVFED